MCPFPGLRTGGTNRGGRQRRSPSEATGKTEWLQSEKRRLESPMGDPPGDQNGNESRSDDQENRRAQDRRRLADHLSMEANSPAARNVAIRNLDVAFVVIESAPTLRRRNGRTRRGECERPIGKCDTKTGRARSVHGCRGPTVDSVRPSSRNPVPCASVVRGDVQYRVGGNPDSCPVQWDLEGVVSERLRDGDVD